MIAIGPGPAKVDAEPRSLSGNHLASSRAFALRIVVVLSLPANPWHPPNRGTYLVPSAIPPAHRTVIAPYSPALTVKRLLLQPQPARAPPPAPTRLDSFRRLIINNL